ncbi:retrovirus-related Pol polyprotein from transposon RE1 isoform X1 [Nymphaea colorata]|nr:retrovirus-related Pol polyprotein from transposon RE1 isoform X1 [Nymphaea colorata]XP_049934545.1 retrovirus-related Pol polyprotein from transposon RE1 isoform X1 [Nymphaea colorata]
MSEISSGANTSSFVSSGEMKSSPFSSFITKMDGGNYEMWAMQVKRTLIAHEKEHLILEPEPVQKVGKYTTWFKDNSLVMVWIVGTLTQDIANEVLHKESAKDMWDSLAATYSQARNETRIMQLHHDIHQMRQDGRPLHTYYSSLKSMFERLNSYFPACKCEQQKAYRDMLMVGVFLSGLDSVYESAKNQMLTSPSIPPIDEAYSRLSRIPIPSSTVLDTTSAMLATRGRGGSLFARGRGYRGRGNTPSRPVCQFCHRIGHTVDKCWQKHGRPAVANQTVFTDSPEQPKTQHPVSSSELRADDIISQLRHLIGDRPQQAPDPTTSTITTAASASSSGMYSDTTDWLIDSGASTHLCGDKAQFTSYVPTPPGRSVILADGKYSPVVGLGEVQLTSSLPLQHVLHAPEFPHSLLSISQITRDLNCHAIFDSSSLVFQDILTGRVIGSGREQGGLYRLVHPFPFAGSTSAGSSSSSAYTWHLRFGHLPFQKLLHVLPQLSPKSSFQCESCQLGKHHRSSFPPRPSRSSHSVFELLHFDVWGPSRTPALQGHRYYLVAVDDYSRVSWVFLMKHKSEVGHVIKNFINEILTQFDTCVKIVRSDNALEFCASSLEQFFRDKGIIHQTSCAYTSQQNGVAERKHRHILDVARTIIIHSHVPHSYWGDAVLTACYLINRMPSSVLGDLIPISVLFPDRDLFSVPPRVFGCVAFVQLLGPGRDKLSPRAIKTIFVGYSRTQKGYRCYDPSTRRYYVSADVTFFESTSFFSPNGTQLRAPALNDEVQFPLPLMSCPNPVDPRFGAVYHRRTKPAAPVQCAPVPSPSTPKVIPDTNSTDNVLCNDDIGVCHEHVPAPNELDVPIAQRKGKRSCTLHPISGHLSMDRLTPMYRQFVKGLSAIALPQNPMDALSDPKWAAAMQEEMDALQSRGTWTLVTPSVDAAIVGCRWVFTIKYRADGSIDRYKARLVAKGYTQTYGVDYYDTFSPVARHASLRILLAVAVSKNWSLSQLDVKNAFLYGDLHEEVYMQQPPGFVAEGECQKVCRLRKAIYGLKQSPRAWFQKLSENIENEGFRRSSADHSLFVKKTSTGTVIVLVYVDDIIVTGDDDQGISNIKDVLGQHFVTKDLGELRYFLGIEFARNQKGLIMCQRKYVTDVLQETGMLGCRPASTPMDINTRLYDDDTEDVDARQYRGIVGKLLYITVTRPDIAYAVSRVSQFMDKPKKVHWDAAMMILRYLKNSPGTGLFFQNGTSLTISVYVDADYAGCPSDRKSTTGFCVFIGSNLVTWKSKKQTVVARSSAESEYRAMAQGTAEVMWVRSLMLDLTVEVPLPK